MQIVGVIPTIRATRLTRDSKVPFVYVPWSTAQQVGTHVNVLPATFYLRTAGDPSNVVASIRTLIHGIDRNLPIDGLESMEEQIDNLLYDNRLVTLLSIAMGVLALTLAAVGLYGVLAFAVTQRTREIGIRMALGANRASISALIAQQVTGMVLAGSAAGALMGWAGTRILISRDSSLAHAPLWVFGASGAALLAAMAAATLLPARHAASVDPIKALRAE
jgi:ABC-type antimicrobial peptide transport system permease subunit